MRRPVLALLGACALAVAACGSNDDPPTPGGAASTATTARPPAPAGALPAGCRRVPAPPPKRERERRPTTRLDRDRTWTVFLETNCGTIVIRLAMRGGPDSATSFASLARRGFYDGLTFHRIAGDPATGPFVIQGGDPLGTGLGGPGYTVVDKPPPGTRYTRGTVAMAKTATEPRGASGSQFFIVTAADAGLPPDYALIGRVVGGEQAVERIASVQTDETERPVAPVVIRRATVRGSAPS
ncbi:MAG TPA: peptidylprolyl isomerase [Solirubrobacteraceae bacterium]|nr:peptidylprolyl isomerase [Solirubrobacteraceae bacterium]